jgi:hypothetical protein
MKVPEWLTLKTGLTEVPSQSDPSFPYPTDELCPALLSRVFKNLNLPKPDNSIHLYLRLSECPFLFLLSDTDTLHSVRSHLPIGLHVLTDSPESLPSIPLSSTKYLARSDRYERNKIIGQGSYGKVFEAIDLRMKQTVAYKLISLRKQNDRMLDLARELRALAFVKHPTIVHFFKLHL